MKNKIINCRLKTFCIIMCSFLVGSSLNTFAQTGERRITGTVVDEQGTPLIGVSITIPKTTTGTATDMNGKYSIRFPEENKQLQFSYIGYISQTLTVSSGNILDVQLKTDAQMLSDVVVIGYGTQKKGDLTGSISSMSSKDFNIGLISSPEQLINGKVSGLQIMSNSGSPTAGSTIRIRGGASLNASNDPLIVLDGVPLERGGISGNDNNFLSLINPSDIESMTILKDASSTAIYGSRASNGVIIITTKKGSSDKLKISFSTTNSIQTRTKTADMLNQDEFIGIINTYGTNEQKALLGNTSTN